MWTRREGLSGNRALQDHKAFLSLEHSWKVTWETPLFSLWRSQSPCWVFLLFNKEHDLRFILRAVTLRGSSCSYFCGLELITPELAPWLTAFFNPGWLWFEVRTCLFQEKLSLWGFLSLSVRDSLFVELSISVYLLLWSRISLNCGLLIKYFLDFRWPRWL